MLPQMVGYPSYSCLNNVAIYIFVIYMIRLCKYIKYIYTYDYTYLICERYIIYIWYIYTPHLYPLIYWWTIYSFHILGIVNNALVNMGRQTSFYILFAFTLDIYTQRIIWYFFLTFLRNLHTVFQIGYNQFTFPQTVCKGFLFSTCSATILISCLFYYKHINRCEVIPHCVFALHFHDN